MLFWFLLSSSASLVFRRTCWAAQDLMIHVLQVKQHAFTANLTFMNTNWLLCNCECFIEVRSCKKEMIQTSTTYRSSRKSVNKFYNSYETHQQLTTQNASSEWAHATHIPHSGHHTQKATHTQNLMKYRSVRVKTEPYQRTPSPQLGRPTLSQAPKIQSRYHLTPNKVSTLQIEIWSTKNQWNWGHLKEKCLGYTLQIL